MFHQVLVQEYKKNSIHLARFYIVIIQQILNFFSENFLFYRFTCWERAALLCVMFACIFVTFPCGVLGKVGHLIVLIPDFYLLSYFHSIWMLFHRF